MSVSSSNFADFEYFDDRISPNFSHMQDNQTNWTTGFPSIRLYLMWLNNLKTPLILAWFAIISHLHWLSAAISYPWICVHDRYAFPLSWHTFNPQWFLNEMFNLFSSRCPISSACLSDQKSKTILETFASVRYFTLPDSLSLLPLIYLRRLKERNLEFIVQHLKPTGGWYVINRFHCL